MSETANPVLLSILATEAMQRQVQSGLDKVDRNATEQDLRQVITNLRTVNEKLVADYNLLVEKHNGLVESYNTLREEALAKKESRTRQNSQIRSEEHTSELQSLMRISYAVFCLKKKKHNKHTQTNNHNTVKHD